PQDIKTALGTGGARLELARQRAVEAADGDEDLHQVLLRHRRKEIQIALDQSGLRDYRERMLAFGQDLENLPGDPELSLDRLIAIGVRADGDRARHVARLRELGAQQLRSVGLREQLGLEVEPRRELEVGVARAGVTVVTHYAVRDEVLGLRGDVVEPHRFAERLDADYPQLGFALHGLARYFALAEDRGVHAVEEPQMLAQTTEEADDAYGLGYVAVYVLHSEAEA